MVGTTDSTSTKSTTVVSPSSTPIPEKASSQPNAEFKDFSNTSDIIVKTPDANISFIDNLSNQIRIVLKHFQGPDPIGIPGASILPEPMNAENVSASMVVATGYFYNITIFGLNNFSIDIVNTFLDQMEVSR